MTGTYRSDAVPTDAILRQIEAAQETLNTHAADLKGLCVTCRETSPCPHREPAVATFYRYFRVSLPQRQPVTVTVKRTPVAWFRNERARSEQPYDNRRVITRDAAQ